MVFFARSAVLTSFNFTVMKSRRSRQYALRIPDLADEIQARGVGFTVLGQHDIVPGIFTDNRNEVAVARHAEIVGFQRQSQIGNRVAQLQSLRELVLAVGRIELLELFAGEVSVR